MVASEMVPSADVISVGEFCSLSGVYSKVCAVRGNLLGVVLEKLGDFWLLFLGV
jgi:hypothetical protein